MRILNYEILYKSLDLTKFNFLAWSSHSGGYLIDYMFGGPTVLMKEFLELSYPGIDRIFAERVYTNNFKLYAEQNDINRVNYFIEDAVKYGIFTTGRHSDGTGDSSTWKNIESYNNNNTSTGKFE
jgi:hypothetical protein